MKAHSTKLVVEVLEDRCVPSTVAYGDFNKDGLPDMAAITAPTTVTVSLAKPDGGYIVSAILSVPKSQSLSYIEVSDLNGDGNLDVNAGAVGGSWQYRDSWRGNGDGTFGSSTTTKWGHNLNKLDF